MQEAKTQLSQLVARAEAGDEVTIARHGVAAVRLVPVEGRTRALGFISLEVPDSSFDPLSDEELDAWEA